MTVVRTSVHENHLSVDQMAARGITHQSIAAEMIAGHLGSWVCEEQGLIMAFAMADKRDGNLFALFTHPDHEGKGFGGALLDVCEKWLIAQGCVEAILDTDRKSRAVAFYKKRGWFEYGGDEADICMKKKLMVTSSGQTGTPHSYSGSALVLSESAIKLD